MGVFRDYYLTDKYGVGMKHKPFIKALDDKTKKEIIKDYYKGMRIIPLSKKYGFSHSVVQKVVANRFN